MKSARVSVVLPTHNRPALIAEALDSLAAQRFKDFEVIVVDDASTPPVAADALARGTLQVRCVRHSTARGGAASKSAGIAAGRGEMFAFLDDDDLYAPAYLERAVDVLDAHPTIDVLFMGVEWFGKSAKWGQEAQESATSRLLADARPRPLERGLLAFEQPLLPAFLKRIPMPFQRPVVRRAALERIGGYRANCLLWDCEWALRASIVARCAFLADPQLYRQRADGQGYSSRQERALEHVESGVDMVRGLLEAEPVPLDPPTRALLRKAYSGGLAELAYEYGRRRRLSDCFGAWWASQKIEPSVARIRVLLVGVARSIGLLGT